MAKKDGKELSQFDFWDEVAYILNRKLQADESVGSNVPLVTYVQKTLNNKGIICTLGEVLQALEKLFIDSSKRFFRLSTNEQGELLICLRRE